MPETILVSVVEIVCILLVVGIFILGYEQLRFLVIAIFRLIKDLIQEAKRHKDESNQ